jgi:hypothetical protein
MSDLDGTDTAARSEARTFGIVSLVLGIVSILSVGCCCIPIVSYLAMLLVPILAIATIITSGVALSAARAEGENQVPAIAGLVMGILTPIIGICGFGLMIGGVGLLSSM